MSVLSSLAARVSALVHPAIAADDLQRTSHEGFLFVHLAVSATALAAAPFFLAFCGSPRPWHVLAFLFLLTPFAACLLLSRTGRLRKAQIMIIAAVLGLATTLDYGIPGLHPAGLALYTLVPLVAAFTLGPAGEDQLAAFLDEEDAARRTRALLLLMLLELKAPAGAPARCLTCLAARPPRVRLTAAGALECFADPAAFRAFVVQLVNDRGDRPAWKIPAETVDDLAELLAHGSPRV